jgi:uncharacterized RDD family membrane protein YckC
MSQALFPPSPPEALPQGLLARRFLALLTDGMLITLLGLFLALCITILGFLTLGLGWFAFHILPWLPLLYFTLLVSAFGATPGQRAFGLRVRQDSDLSAPTPAQALVWALLLWLSFAFACLPFALALFTPRHRAGHDLLAGLVVTRPPKIRY